MRAHAIIRSDIADNADTRQIFGASGDRVLRYVASLAMTAFATMIAIGIDAHVAVPNVSLIFVVPVVIAAAALGAGPSFMSAIVGSLAYNYFLTEPRYSLAVDDPANVLAIGLLLCTSFIVSGLAGYLSRASAEAAELKRRSALLASLGNEISDAEDSQACCSAGAQTLALLFATSAIVLLDDPRGLRATARSGDVTPTVADLQAARTSIDDLTVAHGGTYPNADAQWDFWPLRAGGKAFGAIGIAPRDERFAASGPTIETVAALLTSRLDGFRRRAE